MKDKICLITGANSGIGKATAIALAHQGAKIVMACRNKDKAELAKNEIVGKSGNEEVEIMLVNFASQKSVREFATEFKSKHSKLDILVNNAGLIAQSREVTEDGIEISFAVNHLGHFLLTNLLMEELKNAESARIINVSSEAHRLGSIDFNNLNLENGYSNVKSYANSKLANILFTLELSKRLETDGITANSLHPGVVDSNFAGNSSIFWQALMTMAKPFMVSIEKGAETSVYLASSPEAENMNGKYFVRKKEKEPSKAAKNEAVAKKLWEVSEKLVGLNSSAK